ncbi:phosphoribosylanthranilate isomerase [Arenicellales bacterium IMCC55707]
MKKTQIKVCCIANAEEAQIALNQGINAVGLVGHMPSGPGVIGSDRAASIIAALPGGVDSFFLTSHELGRDIVEALGVIKASTVQIVRHIDPVEYLPIIENLPNLRRIQVIHVENDSALGLIERYNEVADAFLLDSGKTMGTNPQFGGTGKVHDWVISKQFVQSTDLPVYLAGGLSSENVFRAVTEVRPAGVDVCSGVRSNDTLDLEKLQAFVQEVKRADDAINQQ